MTIILWEFYCAVVPSRHPRIPRPASPPPSVPPPPPPLGPPPHTGAGAGERSVLSGLDAQRPDSLALCSNRSFLVLERNLSALHRSTFGGSHVHVSRAHCAYPSGIPCHIASVTRRLCAWSATIGVCAFRGIRTAAAGTAAGLRLSYDHVVMPAFRALRTAVVWLHHNVVHPLALAAVAGSRAAARALVWMHHNAVEPLWLTAVAGAQVAGHALYTGAQVAGGAVALAGRYVRLSRVRARVLLRKSVSSTRVLARIH